MKVAMTSKCACRKTLVLLSFLFIGWLIPSYTNAQFILTDSLPFQKKKISSLAITSAAVYSTGMLALYQVWYKENARQDFHFFNDNAEWKQVDKVGHFYSAFYLSSLSAKGINQCGISARKSATLGAITGFATLLTVEVFDGYSQAYGASIGDLVANATGSSFYWLQQHWWKETRIQPKFSFHRTQYASLRPNVLGNSLATELLKDYNGQTYWLSVDMDKFIQFPKWLNLAVGYGANAMVYANDETNTMNGYTARREYYLALDIDLTSIKTRSRFLKSTFRLLSAIKLPAPSLRISKDGLDFLYFYF